MAPRARDPDVEQPPLLVARLVGLREPRRQLLLVEPRQEDRVELEPLRPVVGQQVHAAHLAAAGIEAAAELGGELGAA